MSALNIYADLNCELDSVPISFRSTGRTIVVAVPDVATGLKMLQLSSPPVSRRQQLVHLKRVLDSLSISLELKIDGRSVLRIGDQTGAKFWTFLGLPRLSLRPNQALRTIMAACRIWK